MRSRTALTTVAALAAAVGFGGAAPASGVPDGPIIRVIHNVLNGAGVCLDSNADGDVYMLACNGGDYQKWIVTRTRNSPPRHVEIRNLATGRCLDAKDSPRANYETVYTLGCNGGGYQRWSDMPNNLRLGEQTRLRNMAINECMRLDTYGDPVLWNTSSSGCSPAGIYGQDLWVAALR